MHVLLFLGAGASATFGKPTTAELKRELVRKYGSQTRLDFVQSLVNCPNFQDIEYVLEAAKQIKNFLATYGGSFFKFMGTQNAFIFYHETDQHIQFHNAVKDWDSTIRKLEDEVITSYRWNHNFDKQLSIIYDPIFKFLSEASERITVFTTNYDIAIEVYCSDSDMYRAGDGFSEHGGHYRWTDGKYNLLKGTDHRKDINLYKLHGSLNWKRHKSGRILRTSEEGRALDPNFVENILIFPTLSAKYDGKEPFVTILSEFQKNMKIADVCIVIGFSFRDTHLSEVFINFIQNKKLLVVVSPTAKDDLSKNLLKREFSTLNKEIEDLYLINTDEEKIAIINSRLDEKTVDKIIDKIRNRLNDLALG
jgi:SIR2-like domain